MGKTRTTMIATAKAACYNIRASTTGFAAAAAAAAGFLMMILLALVAPPGSQLVVVDGFSTGVIVPSGRSCGRLFSSNAGNDYSGDTSGGSSGSSGSGSGGRLEQITYTIYPDGRVEEKVSGVKGKDCLEITKKINEKLGNVITTQPTEEMYEEDIQIDQTQTLYNSDGSDLPGDVDSSTTTASSWEGSSSW